MWCGEGHGGGGKNYFEGLSGRMGEVSLSE